MLCVVLGIPYCDYFIVQTRWVMTRLVVHNENRCMLQIGLDVVFRQNLLLKASHPSSIILCIVLAEAWLGHRSPSPIHFNSFLHCIRTDTPIGPV
jgi:hypothetical protein